MGGEEEGEGQEAWEFGSSLTPMALDCTRYLRGAKLGSFVQVTLSSRVCCLGGLEFVSVKRNL